MEALQEFKRKLPEHCTNINKEQQRTADEVQPTVRMQQSKVHYREVTGHLIKKPPFEKKIVRSFRSRNMTRKFTRISANGS